MQEVDSQLTTIVESSLLRLDRAGIEAEEGADAGRPFRPLEPLRGVPTAAVITLIDFQGQILGSVGGDLSASKIEIALDRVLDRDTYGVPFTFESGNSHYRVLALELPSRVGIVIASISLEDVDDSIARLQYLMLLIGVATMILIIVLSRRAITISLKPLAAVESTAEAIAEGNLSARLPIAKPETEVGRLVGSLNQMLTRIEDSFAVRVKSEEKLRRFVADASHELRTPLTAIRGFAELHRQGAVTGEEKTRELIGRIEDESIRMGTLVEDLLLLARLDQSPEIEREPVNLNELIHSASESARASSPEHQISLVLPEEELFILGDRNRIFQVVANLLENARNHTPAGSSIQVSLTESEDEIKIEVADNGPGIDKHDLERIFERFYRADSSRTRTRKSEGSGLGLSIVKAVMQAHGGDVTVDSTMGVGSTFTLHFPIGKED
jgi:two-component system OmpR family sensor kinase